MYITNIEIEQLITEVDKRSVLWGVFLMNLIKMKTKKIKLGFAN
jgi:hypothetical protein